MHLLLYRHCNSPEFSDYSDKCGNFHCDIRSNNIDLGFFMDEGFCRFRANSNPDRSKCYQNKIETDANYSIWLISSSQRAKGSSKVSAIHKTTDYKRLQMSNYFPSRITARYSTCIIITSGGDPCKRKPRTCACKWTPTLKKI